MSANTTSTLHTTAAFTTEAVREMNLAHLEGAYLYTTAGDSLGALRQQRACSLYVERRLYEANKKRHAKSAQAARDAADAAKKAWQTLKERDWALTYVLYAPPDEKLTFVPVTTTSSKASTAYSATLDELQKKKQVRFADNLPTPERRKSEDDEEDEAYGQ